MSQSQPSDGWMVHGAGVALLGTLLATAWFFGVRPTLAAAESARDAAVAADSLQGDRDLRRNRVAQLDRRVDAARAELQDVRLQVRPISALNQRYADVVDLAASCGIQIGESRTEAPRAENWFVRVPIRVEGRGTVIGVAEFFDRVRRELSDVEVESFEIIRVGGAEGADMMLAIDLAWYAASGEAGIAPGSGLD